MKKLTLLVSCLIFSQDAPQKYNLITTADLLYWTAREDGLAYARDGYVPITQSINVEKRKDSQFAQGNWSAGFRVGMGLQLEHEAWTAIFQYTRYTQDNSSSKAGNLAPTWSIGGIEGVVQDNLSIGPQVGKANASWDYTYNNFVLELGKNFGYFTPHIGMTATWQKQSYDVAYEQLQNISAYSRLSSNMQNNNWGIGARMGTHSKWMFNSIWGFYGDVAIAALWTRFQVVREDRGENQESTVIMPVYNVSDFHTLKGFLDMSLGLCFVYTTLSETLTLNATIGWEEQIWFNENQLSQLFLAGGNQGDLILQGLTISFRLDY